MVKDLVTIDYTNWRGQRSTRVILPKRIAFKKSEWHPEAQWVVTAYDYGKEAERDFAMKDIHSWGPYRDVPGLTP
jgi:predicted DNA-binding transcriptional regulator YafY